MVEIYSQLERSGLGMTSLRTRLRMVERLKAQGIENKKVLDVLANTPRHLFIDKALAHRAYEDTTLPIGYEQTISHPYIVAYMSQYLVENCQPKGALFNVLEIGTGCGYQAYVLAQLFKIVVTIERIQPLYMQAKECFSRLQTRNIYGLYGDGFLGHQQKAPYQAIIATAAPEELPTNLLEQLDEGGICIAPIGEHQANQKLTAWHKDQDQWRKKFLLDVRFVPMLAGVF